MSRALQINSSPQGWMARNTKPVPLAEKGWVITMKKISIILLSAVLVFSMAACNGGKEKADNQTEKQTESVKPTEEVAMATEAVTEVTTEAGSDETEKAYWEEHPYIEFETAGGLRIYQVFAVVCLKKTDEWYGFSCFESKEQYQKAISEIKDRSLYDTGIEPQFKEQLITLSTCFGDSKDSRMVVIGVEQIR